MTDLIIFLVFIIAMTLFTGMIQAIQIEKYKEKIKSLEKDNKLLSELSLFNERVYSRGFDVRGWKNE